MQATDYNFKVFYHKSTSYKKLIMVKAVFHVPFQFGMVKGFHRFSSKFQFTSEFQIQDVCLMLCVKFFGIKHNQARNFLNNKIH